MEGDSLRSPSPLTQDTNRKAYLSDCRQRPKRCSVQELSQSVNSGCHFSSITFELVLPPCKATSTKCEVHNNLFHGSKTSVKWHFTAQIQPSWEKIMGGSSLRSPSPLTLDTDFKTNPSNCRQHPNGHTVWFSSQTVNSGYHISSINSELVLPPTKLHLQSVWLTTIFFLATKFLPNGIPQHKSSQAERKSWKGVRSAHPHHSHRTSIAKPIRAIVGNVLTDIQSDFQADRSTLATTFPP